MRTIARHENKLDLLTFSLAPPGEVPRRYAVRCAVESSRIDRFYRLEDLSFKAHNGGGQVLAGRVEISGREIIVVDTARWLGLRRPLAGDREVKLITTTFFGGRFAYLAHNPSRSEGFETKNLYAPPPLISLYSDCLRGILFKGEESFLVLDLKASVWELEPELEPEQNRKGRHTRVLLVHRSPMVRMLLTHELKGAGYRVLAFERADRAWDYLLTCRRDRLPGMVMTGPERPSLAGLGLCRRIKEHEELAAMPVVIYASLMSNELRRLRGSARADLLLAKPELGSMAAKVAGLLEKAATPAHS